MQRTERCFGTTSAMAVQLIAQYSVGVRWLINCFKTTTLRQLQHCRSCPKMMIYCMQGCKRIRHHRSNQCIMVSNALGGVNGRSRAVILHLDVDQSQQISLPDYLDDAQGACNCCAWFLIKPTSYVVQIKKLTRSHSRDWIPPCLMKDFLTFLAWSIPSNVDIGGSNEIWRYYRSELRPSQSDSKFSLEV